MIRNAVTGLVVLALFSSRSFAQVVSCPDMSTPLPLVDSSFHASLRLHLPSDFKRHSIGNPGYAESWSDDSLPAQSSLTLLVGADTLSSKTPADVEDVSRCELWIDHRPALLSSYSETNDHGFMYYSALISWPSRSGKRMVVMIIAADTSTRSRLIAAARTFTSRSPD
jgi:hypothetical protein